MILDLVVSHNILSWPLEGDEKAAKEGPPIRWVLQVRDPGGSGWTWGKPFFFSFPEKGGQPALGPLPWGLAEERISGW